MQVVMAGSWWLRRRTPLRDGYVERYLVWIGVWSHICGSHWEVVRLFIVVLKCFGGIGMTGRRKWAGTNDDLDGDRL